MSRIADILRRRTNAVNYLPKATATFQSYGGLFTVKDKFSDVYLWMVLNKILRGLKNVVFFEKGDRPDARLANICKFVTENIDLLAFYNWKFGYVVIDVNIDFDGNVNITIPDYQRLQKDLNGNIKGHDIVFYSDLYRFQRTTDFQVLAENKKMIDEYASSDEYLTKTLGAIGFLCGKEMPISKADKDAFEQSLKENAGIGKDKVQVFPFNSEVKYQPIEIPIDKLQLNEKVKDQLMLIAGHFNVPYDLIPFSGKSTYANQEQAVKTFYSDCVSPIAEMGLSVIRYIVTKSKKLWVNADNVTFRIDNVPELVTNRVIDTEYMLDLCKLASEMKTLGLDTKFIENEIKTKYE